MNYKPIFILGLIFEAIGQLLLAQGNDFVYALKPIDFAHWSLFLGAALLTPQIGQFPKSIFTYLGVPTIIIGIVCIIGMCVLDFIWWSQPNQEVRSEFAGQISKIPSIWNPFIKYGPNFLNVGLLILSFNYFKKHKLGVSLIVLATLIVFLGRFIPHRLIYVYLITAIGFGVIFYKKQKNEYQA
ncbi:hypothetical protein OD91_1963 [Lutibacter sp. Hel_I_33_5]|uniref:hypothetical protein n=1 Tax=Lutibacter sp. Hel_I_33_5 TaxID=1566289 RepID=UPI00119F8740|nr:hypothetical protein [Lutibacter sp. Hel_I_33_5]TVZ56667.1 hypothetical protein OD91_1963 [Lutibacter sp. Hel_I_33_5]